MTQFTYGLEIEVANLSIAGAARAVTRAGIQCAEPSSQHTTAATWKAVYDGTSGVSAEVVSPILTAERLNETRTVTRALSAAGATVNRTTGLHVHVGADSFATDESDRLNGIALFVENWYTAHGAIGAMVAKSRLNNHFCKALTIQEADRLAESVRNGDISNGGRGRYYSLNLDSFARHSTVEVRLHHGTLNASKITGWVDFITAMANASKDGVRLNTNLNAPDDSVGACRELLVGLGLAGYLASDTVTYLIQRAEQLNA
jgi:hypothetical protein